MSSSRAKGLNTVTKRQWLPVSGIDPGPPLSKAVIGFYDKGNCVARQSGLNQKRNFSSSC